MHQVFPGDVANVAHISDLNEQCFLRVGAKCQASFEKDVRPRLPIESTKPLLLVYWPAKFGLEACFFVRRKENENSLYLRHGIFNDLIHVWIGALGSLDCLTPLQRI